jgi:hypothetical protein
VLGSCEIVITGEAKVCYMYAQELVLPLCQRVPEQKEPRAEQGVSAMVALGVVLCVIQVSFVVGSLTSSVETEMELPHRF